MDRITALRAFVRLVETGSFSRAAAELRVKQSTVSKWVAALEEQLQRQLVERTTRSKRVTEAGQLLYERAREILAAWEGAEAALLGDAPTLAGRLRVSLPVVFGRRHVVPHVAGFLERHPGVEVELVLDDRYVRLVEEGFDLAIRVGLPVDSSDRCRTLARTPRRLVASPAYLTRAGAPRAPADLRRHACLLHTGHQTPAVWTFTRGRQTVRARVEGRATANNSEALLELARAGAGLALLASWLVDDDIARGTLRPLLPRWRTTDAPIQALLPPTRFVHPRTRAFLDHLAERLRV